MWYKIEKQYRLPNHDYSDNGWYFVTICTKDKEDNLGNVISCGNDFFIDLSDIGKIANKYWLEIPGHFSFVFLDKYVIMPNHIHGIIQINNINKLSGRNRAMPCSTRINQTSVNLINQTPARTNQIPTDIPVNLVNHGRNRAMPCSYGSKFGAVTPGSISTIIGSFKSIVTRTVNKSIPNPNFVWQPRFHDRVIRNQGELNRIRKYIINNPSAWYGDRNFL